MAGCFTPGGNGCHYPTEDNKEKDCKNNPESTCHKEGGGCNRGTQYPGRDRVDRVEVDREGVDLYISIRLKPINIILTILTMGVVAITVLLVRQWFIGQGYNI